MSDPDQILSELEALGEAPLDDAERSLLSDPSELDDLLEVASVDRLLYLSEDIPFEGLSDIEERRAWNKVEGRLARSRPSTDKKGSGAGLRILLAVVAVAAAVALIPMLLPPPSAPEVSPAVSALGEEAHAGLEALGIESGAEAERAETMADQYRRRLEDNG